MDSNGSVMMITLQVDVWRTVAVCLALILFGLWYNREVARLEGSGDHEGYLSLLVVVGVAVTIVGWLVVTGDLAGGLVLLVCFAASGLPMIAGSISRYLAARRALRHQQQELTREVLDHD